MCGRHCFLDQKPGAEANAVPGMDCIGSPDWLDSGLDWLLLTAGLAAAAGGLAGLCGWAGLAFRLGWFDWLVCLGWLGLPSWLGWLDSAGCRLAGMLKGGWLAGWLAGLALLP